MVLLLLALAAWLAGLPLLVTIALALFRGVALLGGTTLRPLADRLAVGAALRDGALAPALMDAIPGRPRFVAREPPLAVGATAGEGGGVAGVSVPAGVTDARGDSASAGAFRQATIAMLVQAAGDRVESEPPRSVVLRELRERLAAELDPRATIGARVRDRLQRAEGLVWQPADPLEPVLAGPDFPQPMYRALAELSPEWLLPGLDQVGANTVTLAETNQAFVEAYMLGSTTRWDATCCGASTRPTSGAPSSASSGTPAGSCRRRACHVCARRSRISCPSTSGRPRPR